VHGWGSPMMFGPQAILAAVLFSVVTALGGWTHGWYTGNKDGAARIEAKWSAAREIQHQAAEKAYRDRIEAENRLSVQMQEQARAHTEELARLDAASDRARRELVRLRAALATRAVIGRQLAAPPAAGSPPDGAPADTGEFLGACAGELLEVGRQAGALAGQVIGLQKYARAAQQACGGAP
jgi:sRNA-binding protein